MNNVNNAELYDIIPFKEDKSWYLKLIYKYEDEYGKHSVVIPKAAIPFVQRRLPPIMRLTSHPHIECNSSMPYIECNSSMPLYKNQCNLALERGIKRSDCYFDIITDFTPKKMTLDEIEKELGYKVMIINNTDISKGAQK